MTSTSLGWRSRLAEPRLAVLVGTFLLSAAGSAYEIVPASITPLVMDRLGVGPVDAGWLVSVMFLTAVVVSLPVGVVLDRADVRRTVAVATGAFLVACVTGFVAADTGSYSALLASRALGAVGYITLWNAGTVLVAGAYGGGSRATAVGVFTASAPAGFALGQFTGPLVAETLGWAAVFAVYGLVGVVGLAVFWSAGAGVVTRTGNAGGVPTRAEFRAVLTDRAVWTICLLGFFAYALYLFLNSWMPTYLTEEAGLSLALSGVFVGFFPAIGILSRTGGGAISDRLFDGQRRPVALLSFAVTLPTFAGFALSSRVAVLFGLLVVAGFFIQLGLGLYFSYIREVVDATVAGTAISLLTAVGLFGAFVAPVGAGWLIERTGSFEPAFVVAGVLTALGLGLAWFAPNADTQ